MTYVEGINPYVFVNVFTDRRDFEKILHIRIEEEGNMPNYTPVFSPKIFYKTGSSLWRFVKYGHGKSTNYVDPFSEASLTAPCAPYIEKRIENLMHDPNKLPPLFQERAANFLKSSVYFPVNNTNNYPGDGYLFFMDPFFLYDPPTHTDPNVFEFYNYLYSYRHLLSRKLFDFLIKINWDTTKIKLFYGHRSRIFKNTSAFDMYNKLCNMSNYQIRIELAFLSRMFGRSLINISIELGIPVLHFLSYIYELLEDFTLNASKRILFNPQATRQSIINSINLIRDTKSLINRPLPQKFDSVNALQTYHDNAMEFIYRETKKKRADLKREYSWDCQLVELINTVSEGQWYIPICPEELIRRGIDHHNCVGSYFERHFKEPDISGKVLSKTLILFSDEAEAEIRLVFKSDKNEDKKTSENIINTVCTNSRLMQCKTRYNKLYPPDIPERLCAAFIGCNVNIFTPSVVRPDGIEI